VVELTVDRSGWRLCSTAMCEVGYFQGRETVLLDGMLALPFHKRDDPARLVCFCFEHSVAEVEADLREHGKSTIAASIRAACKAKRDACTRKNPQGRCCLGNIAEVVRAASTSPATADADADADAGTIAEPDADSSCCSATPLGPDLSPSSTRATTAASTGLFASAGALLAAVLSSACCWLPLTAIGLGASAAGLGAWFEAWRAPLLLATFGLLGAGFYLVYRKPACAPGDTCELPNPRVRRFNRGILWTSTALVAVFALFPEYVGALGRETSEVSQTGEISETHKGQTSVRYSVEGMSCAGCEGHAREAIEGIPGVASAEVSHREGSAQVVWNTPPDHPAVSEAISELGYRAEPLP